MTTKPNTNAGLLDRVTHPEVFDIAQTVVALAIVMTCTLHAGFAEAQQQGLKSFVLILLALPACGYIIAKPKPKIYTFGESLDDFQPSDPFGSDESDLAVVQVGCSRREAIETACEDALQNVETQPTADAAVTSDSFQSARHIPLGAIAKTRASNRSDSTRNVLTRLMPIVRRITSVAFGNASTTAGVTVGGLVLAMAVFA